MEEPVATAPPADRPTRAPGMDVIAPHTPPADAEPAPHQEHHAAAEQHHDHEEEPEEYHHDAERPDDGVFMAIFATVIIVLGLAAMATYAYLKTR